MSDKDAHTDHMPELLMPHAQTFVITAVRTAIGNFKDFKTRVAALLDIPQFSDILAVEYATQFRRPTYACNAIVTGKGRGRGTHDVAIRTVARSSVRDADGVF